jgi:hypothetical protein
MKVSHDGGECMSRDRVHAFTLFYRAAMVRLLEVHIDYDAGIRR